MKGRRFLFWIGMFIRWHFALGTWQMLHVASLSPGHFCGFISCVPTSPLGCNCHEPGRALCSKCCWFIIPPPPPSPWFSRGPIPTKPNTSCEVQVPFPGGPIRKEIKWLKASSLSRVVYLWSMGKIPTIESSFSGFEDSLSHFFTFDVNVITAAPFEVREGKAHCTTQLSLSIKNE